MTEAVHESLARVSGFTEVRAIRKMRHGRETVRLASEHLRLPGHIELFAKAKLALTPKRVPDFPHYNIVSIGDSYLALTKALGPISPGVEKLGERQRRDPILTGSTLEELEARLTRIESL